MKNLRLQPFRLKETMKSLLQYKPEQLEGMGGMEWDGVCETFLTLRMKYVIGDKGRGDNGGNRERSHYFFECWSDCTKNCSGKFFFF
jgi:hypothetical protein